jgi:hypothetical protein
MAPSRPRLRGARARPTPPRGTPAPSAPGAAALCGPATPACRSVSSSAHREPPCRSDTNAQANREQRGAERQRYHDRWSSATASSERQVPHGRSGTSARAMSSARSPRPPRAWTPRTRRRVDRIKNRAALVLQKDGPDVRPRPVSGSCGQPADPRNDRRLQAFRRPCGRIYAGVKTLERVLTMEVLYQLS